MAEERGSAVLFDLLHLAALEQRAKGASGRFGSLPIPSERDCTPLTWTGLCGLRGLLYAYGGQLRELRLCPVCVAAVNRSLDGKAVEWGDERAHSGRSLRLVA